MHWFDFRQKCWTGVLYWFDFRAKCRASLPLIPRRPAGYAQQGYAQQGYGGWQGYGQQMGGGMAGGSREEQVAAFIAKWGLNKDSQHKLNSIPLEAQDVPRAREL